MFHQRWAVRLGVAAHRLVVLHADQADEVLAPDRLLPRSIDGRPRLVGDGRDDLAGKGECRVEGTDAPSCLLAAAMIVRTMGARDVDDVPDDLLVHLSRTAAVLGSAMLL